MSEATVREKWNSISAFFGTDEVYTFDLEGRLLWAYQGGRTYRRSLDHRLFVKFSEQREGIRLREIREIPADEARAWLEAVHRKVAQEAPPSLKERLARWTPEAYEEDRRKFLEIYRPVSILPPDQYMAVVLQLTEGCAWNRCTFCSFYRDRPYRVKTAEAFEAHIRAVQTFFGRALIARRSIFLADANALAVSSSLLIAAFEAIAHAFPLPPPDLTGSALLEYLREHPEVLRGVFSFLDIFTGIRKSIDEFRELRARNLRRVYIGLETGDPFLLRWINKPGTPEEALELVETLKRSGIHVGLILLAGVGGRRFANQHVSQTLRLLARMPLDSKDLIYLSPLVVPPDSAYAQRAQEDRVGILSRKEIETQLGIFRKVLTQPGGPRISIYDIREFIY